MNKFDESRNIGFPVFRKNDRITKNDFFIATKANWDFVKGISFEDQSSYKSKADFVSDSGSMYFYGNNGVHRISTHYSKKVASCSWLLEGKEFDGMNSSRREVTGNLPFAMGFCLWKDFKRKIIRLAGFEGFFYGLNFYPLEGKYEEFKAAYLKTFKTPYSYMMRDERTGATYFI